MDKIFTLFKKQKPLKNKQLKHSFLLEKDSLATIFFVCGILHIYALLKTHRSKSPENFNPTD